MRDRREMGVEREGEIGREGKGMRDRREICLLYTSPSPRDFG